MVIARHMVITKGDYLTKWLKQFTGISIHTVLTEGDVIVTYRYLSI